MNLIDIIRKKRFGGELDEMEIRAFVKGVVDGTMSDYQVSALLLAISINAALLNGILLVVIATAIISLIK